MKVQVHELIKVLEVEVVPQGTEGGDPLVLRIEIFSDGSVFRPKVYCWSTFRIPPTFSPNSPNSESISQMQFFDKELMALDEGFEWQDIRAGGVSDAIDQTLKVIERQLVGRA
jgi:hypothetical protein